MPVNPVFELREVETDHLKKIHLKIDRGTKTAVIGPSGAGKTSLFLLLNRLKDPVSGKILFLGRALKKYPVRQLRKRVGLVLQSAELFEGTVLDNLRYGPSLFGEWDERKAGKLLEMVHLPRSYLQRDAEKLSGGEMQRVALARTLANEPDVLLLDEATSALDVATTEAVEDSLRHYLAEKKATLLFITHRLNQAARLSERTIYLEEGRIVESGPTERLLKNPESSELQRFLKGEIK